MISSFFYDHAHADMYANDCLVMFKGIPHYVIGTSRRGRGELFFKILPLKKVISGNWDRTRDEQEVNVNDKDVCLSIPRLGMMNWDKHTGAYYVTRMPKRMWKVSVNDRNLKIFQTHLKQRGWRDRAIFTTPFLNMLENKYPPVDATINALKDGMITWAFHKKFCLANDLTLRYKYNMEPVGRVEGKVMALYPQNSFLIESLQEALAHENYRADVW